MAASKSLPTRLTTRSFPTPFVAKITVQVCSCTPSINVPILTPQSVHTMRVFIPIWIHNREDVPIDILHWLTMSITILSELIYDVRNRRWRDPLSRMNTCEIRVRVSMIYLTAWAHNRGVCLPVCWTTPDPGSLKAEYKTRWNTDDSLTSTWLCGKVLPTFTDRVVNWPQASVQPCPHSDIIIWVAFSWTLRMLEICVWE